MDFLTHHFHSVFQRYRCTGRDNTLSTRMRGDSDCAAMLSIVHRYIQWTDGELTDIRWCGVHCIGDVYSGLTTQFCHGWSGPHCVHLLSIVHVLAQCCGAGECERSASREGATPTGWDHHQWPGDWWRETITWTCSYQNSLQCLLWTVTFWLELPLRPVTFNDGMSMVALQVYCPPWEVCRGLNSRSRVNSLPLLVTLPTVISFILLITTMPLESTHSTSGHSMYTMTLQVSMSTSPAVVRLVFVMATIGEVRAVKTILYNNYISF